MHHVALCVQTDQKNIHQTRHLFIKSLTVATCFGNEPLIAVPLQARSGPEGSRKLSSADFITTAQDGGKVVSLTHRPPLPPGNTPVTHFC